MANPFLTAAEARAWIAMGDKNARAALQFADAARQNWARAKELLDQAEREQRELAEQIASRRGFAVERTEFDLWESIRAEAEKREEGKVA